MLEVFNAIKQQQQHEKHAINNNNNNKNTNNRRTSPILVDKRLLLSMANKRPISGTNENIVSPSSSFKSKSFIKMSQPAQSLSNNNGMLNIKMPNECTSMQPRPLNIRFLLFLEDSDGSRSNIFDSAKFNQQQQEQQTLSHSSKLISRSNSFNSSKLNNEMLTRMVFGSFPMVVTNKTAIKVHSLKNSNKTMISNVFVYYNNRSQKNFKFNSNLNFCYCNNHHHNQLINNQNSSKINQQNESAASKLLDSFKSIRSNSGNVLVENKNRINENNELQNVKEGENGVGSHMQYNSKPIDIKLVGGLTESTSGTSQIDKYMGRSGAKGCTKMSISLKNNNELCLTSEKHNITSNRANMMQTTTNTGIVKEQPHSTSSSLLSSNSSSNLYLLNNTSTNSSNRSRTNINNNATQEQTCEDNTNSPCSSVPTYYGSYSGIYRRLMRSLSNSLISSTTAINQNTSEIDKVSELDSNLYKQQQQQQQQQQRKMSLSGVSTSSDIGVQPWLCEKCIENNCYPKYKIGVSVLFCLPPSTNSMSPSSTTTTPPSSPLSASYSPVSKPTQTSPTHSSTQTSQHHDPLVLFPSAPSMPSSPTNTYSNDTYKCLNSSSNSSMTQTVKQANNNQSSANDNFYEFFFSHLPIIEYQIKELKEKVINNLPLYFQQQQQFTNSNSSNRAQQNSPCASTSFSFVQKMLNDFQEYENKFNLLYTSPRLSMPAWLTVINNKKLTHINASTNCNSNSSSVLTLNNSTLNTAVGLHTCNSLINELVYINKIINPKLLASSTSSTSISDSFLSSSASKRFLNSFKNSLSINKGLNGNNQEQSTASSSSFLSVLLSTILKHHLSWVYTVLPSNDLTMSTVTSNTTASLRKRRAQWTSVLEKKNPYNPLWAQLGDLHGAINQPLKLVRTVVVGKNRDLVERLLFLLSYFIRCGNSSYFDITADEFDFDKLPGTNMAATSSSHSASPCSSIPTSSPIGNLATKSSPTKLKTSLSFRVNLEEEEDEEEKKYNENESSINNSSNNNAAFSREINLLELNTDPLAQFSALLANATSSNNFSMFIEQSTACKKHDTNRYEMGSHVSSVSSSSMTSPSCCSVSSSPLNHQKQPSYSNSKKANSTTNSSINGMGGAIGALSSSLTLNTNKQYAASSTSGETYLKNTEKKKQINLSSNSLGNNNCNAKELPLIGCQLKPNNIKSTRMEDNFGYSLLASYCDEFVFEFVLHGTSDRSFLSDLHEKLVFSKQNSIIDSPIDESIYIVVDVDELNVKVYSSESPWQPTKEKSIGLVDSLTQSVLDMIKLFQNSEFVLIHLEDKLQEFYNKALTLNQLKSQMNEIDDKTLIKLMELNDESDLDFLNRILKSIVLPNIF